MNQENIEYLALCREAESQDTSQERLKELAAINDDIAQIVANNVATPSELLAELARHKSKAVRKAVTSNPNTPIETLLKLGDRFPQELLDNPILALLVLEDLNFLDNIPDQTLNTLIQQPKVPKFLLDYAKNNQNVHIRETAKMQVVLSGEMIEGWHETVEKIIPSYEAINKLRLDFHEAVSEYISCGFMYEEIFDRMMGLLPYCYKFLKFDLFKGRGFRYYVAKNRNLEPILSKQFACDKDSLFRCGIAENPTMPAEILELLINDRDVKVRRALAKNPNTPIEILKSFATDSDNNIRRALAENPNTPIEILKSFATDSDNNVRLAIAGNSSTPPEILKSLLNNYNDSVYKAVVGNPSTPSEILELLLDDCIELILNDYNKFIFWGAVINPSTPPDILESLAKNLNKRVSEYMTKNSNSLSEKEKLRISDGTRKIIQGIARNPNTPIEVLKSLANDANEDVRKYLALNPNTPVEILEAFANSSHRIFLASNPNIPMNLLESLANDSDEDVRVALVEENPNIPLAILKKLANDSGDLVLESILENPQCTFEIIEIIFKNFAKSDTPSFNRVALFTSDYAESSVLAENSNSILWLERYAIACNQKTPTDTLKQLAKDGNRIIRAPAKESLEKRQ